MQHYILTEGFGLIYNTGLSGCVCFSNHSFKGLLKWNILGLGPPQIWFNSVFLLLECFCDPIKLSRPSVICLTTDPTYLTRAHFAWQEYLSTFRCETVYRERSPTESKMFWPRTKPAVIRSTVLNLVSTVNNLPGAFWCGDNDKMCSEP